MKSEKFEIKANGVLVDTRRKWNASIRSIEANIRARAKEEGTQYELIDSSCEKEGFYFVRGYRVWKGQNGNVVKFEIEKRNAA